MRELPAEIVNKVINFNCEDLTKLLEKSGYFDCEYDQIFFESINASGDFVFETVFEYEGIPAFGNVYVIYENNTLRAEF